MKKTIAAAVIALLLSGCSFFRSKTKFYPSGLVFPLDKAGEIFYDGEIFERLALEDDQLFFSTRKGWVYCISGQEVRKALEADKGRALGIPAFYFPNSKGLVLLFNSRKPELAWIFQAPRPLMSPVFLGPQALYVFDDSHSLYCLDKSGHLNWQKDFDAAITSPIVEANGRVYLGTEAGDFVVLDANSGSVLWRYGVQSAIRSNPVAVKDMVIFGSDDQNLYLLDGQGALVDRFDAQGRVGSSLLAEKGVLYFGVDNQQFCSLNLRTRRLRWKVRVGGAAVTIPVIQGKRLFFIGSNNILYCLNKNNGTILWWKSIPARSAFQIAVVDKRILVTSLSTLMVSFDLESGQSLEAYSAEGEFRSNPVWLSPYLLLNQYDSLTDTGRLQFLEKRVHFALQSSRGSPVEKNQEIRFTCETTGFFKPKFEFSLQHLMPVRFGLSLFTFIPEDVKKNIVQESSEKNSWAWLPDQTGLYIIEAVAADLKENKKAEVPFMITAQENLRWRWWVRHQSAREASLFKNLHWEALDIFPNGAVTDVEVVDSKKRILYAGTARGGLWKSTNQGSTWMSLMEYEASLSVSDLAVAPSNPDILWVGTGENDSPWVPESGAGVLKSTDAGLTWKNMGLQDTYHIGRILIHPDDPQRVYVAAMGHLSGLNQESGVFRTFNGGLSWERVLFVDTSIGLIDLVMDPTEPKSLYAAAWERSRRPWSFVNQGKGSGLYKTTDGGDTWRRLETGFSSAGHTGRIGLAVSPASPHIVYAVVDDRTPIEERRVKEPEKKFRSGISLEKLAKMRVKDFAKLEKQSVQQLLQDLGAPSGVSVDSVLARMQRGELSPLQLTQAYQEKQKSRAPEKTRGLTLYRSADRGETWSKVSDIPVGTPVAARGSALSRVRVHPQDPQRIWVLGSSLWFSADGGASFEDIGQDIAPLGYTELWSDREYPEHLIAATGAGLRASYDGGMSWRHIASLRAGSVQSMACSRGTDGSLFISFEGLGLFRGRKRAFNKSEWVWDKILDGDVEQVTCSPADSDVVYASLRGGQVIRLNLGAGVSTTITPEPDFWELPPRFGRFTPVLVSPHNRLLLYAGADRVYKSYDGGGRWHLVSPELTSSLEAGNIPFGNIVVLSESPLVPGLVYAGTDDGLVWMTRNGGATWERIIGGLPTKKRVSCIQVSAFEQGIVYMSLDGSHEEDFEKYLFQSGIYGLSWNALGDNLPSGPVNVIREDPIDNNILYAGTDFGVYISMDRGGSWMVLGSGLAHVPVKDILIGPGPSGLLIATHGRGLLRMDRTAVVQLSKAVKDTKSLLLPIDPVVLPGPFGGDPSGVKVYYFLEKKQGVTLTIQDSSGKSLRTFRILGWKGCNEFVWDLTLEAEKFETKTIPPGEYKIVIRTGDLKMEGTLRVRDSS